MRKKIYGVFIGITLLTVLITSTTVIFLMRDFFISKEPMVLSEILREESIFYFFYLFLPALVGITVFVVLAAIFISSNISNDILSSIRTIILSFQNRMDDRGRVDVDVYEEFEPFIKIFEFQNSEINLQMEKLQDANKRRRDFTANVSHELKTPLVSINGYAEIIESGLAKEEDIKKFAGIIKDQGMVLLDLINEIIELSKLDDEKYCPEFEEVSLRGVGLASFERLAYIAEKKDISIKIEGDATIQGNTGLITEMIYNLLENSIKYGKNGGKTDMVILPGKSNVTITIRDNGQGIPEEDQERVFERFFRVDKSHSKKIHGTGLGLAIVKHIVEIHKGDIRLTSELGKGTKIEISLPME